MRRPRFSPKSSTRWFLICVSTSAILRARTHTGRAHGPPWQRPASRSQRSSAATTTSSCSHRAGRNPTTSPFEASPMHARIVLASSRLSSSIPRPRDRARGSRVTAAPCNGSASMRTAVPASTKPASMMQQRSSPSCTRTTRQVCCNLLPSWRSSPVLLARSFIRTRHNRSARCASTYASSMSICCRLPVTSSTRRKAWARST